MIFSPFPIELRAQIKRLVDDVATARLVEAARGDDIGAARVALEAGADPHGVTPVAQHEEAVSLATCTPSPLSSAAKRGSREMAMLLMDQGGADPNQGRTADGGAHGGSM